MCTSEPAAPRVPHEGLPIPPPTRCALEAEPDGPRAGRGGVGGDCDQPGARAGRGARVSRERKSGSPGGVCVSERLDWRD